jgi:4-hydroxybenzoate polyprenyltransferase
MQNATLLFLAEMVVCLLFWLLDTTAGYIFTVAVSSIAAAMLVIALIADRIEASKISRTYYYGMLITIVAPLAAWGLVFVLIGN